MFSINHEEIHEVFFLILVWTKSQQTNGGDIYKREQISEVLKGRTVWSKSRRLPFNLYISSESRFVLSYRNLSLKSNNKISTLIPTRVYSGSHLGSLSLLPQKTSTHFQWLLMITCLVLTRTIEVILPVFYLSIE